MVGKGAAPLYTHVVMNTSRPIPRFTPPFLLAAFLLAFFLVAPASAQEAKLLGTFDDWEAYLETDGGETVCYMGSQPSKAVGKYKKRGETYILVTHRPKRKTFGVVSVRAGYAYKKDSEVTLTIGENAFRLFTDVGHAFAYDRKTDAAIVKAMVRGKGMVVQGTSSRGTKTTDTYSLKGFTAAWKAINKACKAK